MPAKTISIHDCYDVLRDLTRKVTVLDELNRALDLSTGVDKAIKIIQKSQKAGAKLIFIGNGASAAISSHMAADYWKNGGIRAISFNDPALLTCVSNDFSYEQVFERPVGMFACKGDTLVAISSSGRSKNILKGAEMARKMKCRVITLSGFSEDNPLRSLGDLNFHVPACAYSHVEVMHHSILHYILDIIVHPSSKGK